MSANIAFIGGGNMAASIIGGLVASGFEPSRIWASDPMEESLQRLQAIAPIHTASDNDAIIAEADVVVLAVKPQIMKPVISACAPAMQARKPLVISIAAGITLGSLQEWLGDGIPLVRCMPNTPALVQQGITGLFASAEVNDGQKNLAGQILGAVGTTLWFETESALDAVTAVSGSGPAYFFLVMEAMQAAGEKLGLSAADAKALTLQTALGAATMACQSDVDAAELRRRVTSPKGTTEAAINELQHGGLSTLFETALTAARDRSIALARELGEH